MPWSVEAEGSSTAKFIQVCASQNDLFALDEAGDVYQYDFSVRAWVRLAATRKPDETDVGEAGGGRAAPGGRRGSSRRETRGSA